MPYPIIAIPMILPGFKKHVAHNTLVQIPLYPPKHPRAIRSSTKHIGNLSEFFKNPGGSCGSCGRGVK